MIAKYWQWTSAWLLNDNTGHTTQTRSDMGHEILLQHMMRPCSFTRVIVPSVMVAMMIYHTLYPMGPWYDKSHSFLCKWINESISFLILSTMPCVVGHNPILVPIIDHKKWPMAPLFLTYIWEIHRVTFSVLMVTYALCCVSSISHVRTSAQWWYTTIIQM